MEKSDAQVLVTHPEFIIKSASLCLRKYFFQNSIPRFSAPINNFMSPSLKGGIINSAG